MTMTPRLRKFALTAHVIFSVGWFGAVVAYLVTSRGRRAEPLSTAWSVIRCSWTCRRSARPSTFHVGIMS